MKKVSVIALFLILALCLTGAASAAPKYKLLFGHTLTENDAFHKGMVAWAEAVAKDTNGEKEKASLREIGSNLKTSGWALAFPFLLLFVLRLGISLPPASAARLPVCTLCSSAFSSTGS